MQSLTKLVLCSCILAVSIPAYSQIPFRPQALAPARASKPMVFGLPDGTPVRLRTGRQLSSANEKPSESVDFEVVNDVRINDVIVVAHDSTAFGTVTVAKPRGRAGKAGKLDISVESLVAVTGERVPLRAAQQNTGDSQLGTMTAGMVISGILFFPAAPLFLFVKGKDVIVPKGTEITAYVNGDTPLDQAKIPSGLLSYKTSNGTQLTSTVTFKSEPDGADVTIDGKFIGNTPSTLALAPGDHAVTINKTVFKGWQRTITCTAGGIITINAALEKTDQR